MARKAQAPINVEDVGSTIEQIAMLAAKLGANAMRLPLLAIQLGTLVLTLPLQGLQMVTAALGQGADKLEHTVGSSITQWERDTKQPQEARQVDPNAGAWGIRRPQFTKREEPVTDIAGAGA